jgi:glycosyltransferase involved in cell wall biosynthesis
MPRVSICIPAYKPAHFELCLASAVAQTFSDTEIIVSDDCKTDAIRDICAKFPGRVSYSRNPNPGARNNVLRLMEMAQGEYIKFLFDDDILHPMCVQYLFQLLEGTKAQNTRLAFSPRDAIDKDNQTIRSINMLQIAGPGSSMISGPQSIAVMASNCCNVVGEFTTTMFRKKDCYDASGRITLIDLDGTPCRALGDVFAWVNLAQKGNIVAHPVTLSYFREQKGTNSDPDVNPNFVYALTEWETVIGYAAKSGYLAPPAQAKAYQTLSGIYHHWRPKFPQLVENLQRLDRHLSLVSA